MVKNIFLFLSIFVLALIFLVLLFFMIYRKKQLAETQLKPLSPLSVPNNSPNHNLHPIASNQWFSNIYTTFPTQPLFVMPQSYVLSPQGLEISFPKVVKTKNTIAAPFIKDFTIGFDEPFIKPKIQSLGDWNASIIMRASNNLISFDLAHGVPYTVLHITGDSIKLRLASPYTLYNYGKTIITKDGNYPMRDFMLSINNNNYIIVLDADTTVTVARNTITIPHVTRLFVGILDKKDNYNLFVQNADAEVLSTHVTYTTSQHELKTTYSIQSPSTSLLTLYPHQQTTLTTHFDTLGSYNTLRGRLDLIESNSFTTSVPLLVPPQTFLPLSQANNEFISTIHQDVSAFIKDPAPTSEDYYLGTWLGKGTSLLQLSKIANNSSDQKALQSFLEAKLYTALQNFIYDKSKTSIIALKPEFGNENLNDHHFHYGYYIRCAAVISQLDPVFFAKIKNKVDLLVKDIASSDRQGMDFPYLRNFDIYESHSWADGFANFGDGNDQESSSEAINAWYGVYLWGVVSGDTQMQNTGLYLYNSEIQGATYYWFGKNGMFIPPYEHSIASLIWGGKVDFATWFSPETNMKYGIQLLPFTPASSYLATVGPFTPFDNDFSKSGGKITSSWGDLFLMWKSFYNPQQAFVQRNNVTRFESDNPRSLFLYFLLFNLQIKPS